MTDQLSMAPLVSEPPVNRAAPRQSIDSLTESEGLDLVGLLSTVDETAYVWDLATDDIEWEGNAATVLGLPDGNSIATGSRFQFHLAPEHASERARVVAAANSVADARGFSYRLEYRFYPTDGRGAKFIWIEDQGRCWPASGGRPSRARGIIRIIDERYREEQRLLCRSEQDELTGQLNRIRLTDALSAQLDRNLQTRQQSAFLVIAVNNLAVINETFGFSVGDEVISAVARAIREKMRAGDVIGRYSSNKFGVLLNDCGPGPMRIAADRFMKSVRDTTIRSSSCQLSATISIGGVVFPEQAPNVQSVLNNALKALDDARCKRLESFAAYEVRSKAESVRRRKAAMADEVMEALDEKRMRLVLQPLIGAQSNKPELYECLLRMERRDGSFVPAGEFIPIVEQLGLSRLIDRRTLELAVELLALHPDLKLSLNVSGLTCGDHEWLVALRRLTTGRKDITKRLVIEITETAAIDDLEQSSQFVQSLKDFGCRVAIDDFGAGYTSFKNLKVLNVDMVKIDGTFVKNLADDTSDQVFINTMIHLAKSFGMETVAEWVGDARAAEMLRDAGITYLQGFHYGLPIAAEQLAA